MLYDLIVIYKSSRGKMNEGCKDGLVPVAENQQIKT